ncbi:hypothetical protein BKA69DRAFT_1122170 [Paraphysoderma sedebokerense]|nr:hypothetical protein BKA69DRAFT_1122170 [Paraphysoderma sedebokerense]
MTIYIPSHQRKQYPQFCKLLAKLDSIRNRSDTTNREADRAKKEIVSDVVESTIILDELKGVQPDVGPFVFSASGISYPNPHPPRINLSSALFKCQYILKPASVRVQDYSILMGSHISLNHYSSPTVSESQLKSVEEKTKMKLNSIIKFGSDDPNNMSDNIVIEASRLIQRIEEYKTTIIESRKHTDEKTWEFFELFNSYAKLISSLMILTHEVIIKFKSNLEFEKSKAFNDYFAVIVSNISLKLKILKYEIILSQYDDKVVEGLHNIKQFLENELSTIKSQSVEVSDKLRDFETAAMGNTEFTSLVEIYAKLLGDLDCVREDIERLKG